MSGASKHETRVASSPFELHDDSGHPVIRGTPIVFNSWSRVMRHEQNGRVILFREIVLPHAVDRTLGNADEVLAYWNHEASEVIGNTRSGTLRLRKSHTAVDMELHPSTEWTATYHYAAVKRGDVRGMSFAFGVVGEQGERWSDFPDEDGIWEREIHDMAFSEVSIVGRPAYPATSVSTRAMDFDKVSLPSQSLAFFTEERLGASVEYLRMVHRQRLAG